MKTEGYVMHHGDALAVLRTLSEDSVQCCVTSPPYYGLRDYGIEGQIGLERTPQEYVEKLVDVFTEVHRVLKPDGVLWLNLGDSYATGAGRVGDCPGGGKQGNRWKGGRGGHEGKHAYSESACGIGPLSQPNRMPLPGLKPKDLIGIPWRVAFALQEAGWWLRSDVIWCKDNPMPESVQDRPTRAHEYVFLLSKSQHYFYDIEAIKEPGIYAGPNGKQQSPYAQGFGRRTKAEERERQDKQRGHSRRHAGFNDRWDAMDKRQQCNVMRNVRSWWRINPEPIPEAHFATFPIRLAERCILAGSRIGDIILDPFAGAGTAWMACLKHGREFVGIELNPAYIEISKQRALKHFPLLVGSFL